MTTDESGQLSESTSGTESQLSESISQAGTSSAPPDVDTRPIGACYNELQAVKAAGLALRTAVENVKAANARFWACRDAAKATAGTAPANHYRGLYQASIFDSLADQITQLESMVENFQ